MRDEREDVRDEYEPQLVHGRILNVRSTYEHDYLASSASGGAGSITLDDATGFDENGGQLTIVDDNGDENVYTYTAVDLDTGVVTLSGTLGESHDAGVMVREYPEYRIRLATVTTDHPDGGTIEARVPLSLRAYLNDGPRSDAAGDDEVASDPPEDVLVEYRDGAWMVVDVLGRDPDDAPNRRPATPSSPPTLTFKATEAKTHLQFTGKIKFTELTLDTAGKFVEVDMYQVQWVACDVNGDPVELEDGVPRYRDKVKVRPKWAELAGALDLAGTAARFATCDPHDFEVDQVVTVAGVTPSGYNGSWTITAVPNSQSFEADIGTSPGDATRLGYVRDGDDTYSVITRTLHNPRTVYWKARYKGRSAAGKWSLWSAWTAPGLPWTGANPKPPAPTFGLTPIEFDRIGRARRRRFRLKFTFNEVEDFDYPGSPADDEEDVQAYWVRVDRSDDGVTWDGTPWYRKKKFSAKADSDGDTTVTSIFTVGRRQWYRCSVRTLDRFNRLSDWSDWTDAAWPNDNTRPPNPSNVRIFESATDRIVVDWDEPTADYPTRGTVSGTSGTATLTGVGTKFLTEVEAGTIVKVGGNTYTVKTVASDTSMTLTANLSTSPSGAVLYEVEEHPDVAYYEVQIAKSANVSTAATPDEWSAVHMRDKRTGTRRAFKVKNADAPGGYYGRVRSVDMALNKGQWIYAGSEASPNSNPNDNGVSSAIGAGGGGKTKHKWSFLGRLRVLSEDDTHDLDIDEAMTLKKVRARVKQAPTGQAVIVEVWKNNVTSCGTVTIAAGAKRGASDALNVAFADTDSLSISINQVGSSFRGRNLTVVAVLDPT